MRDASLDTFVAFFKSHSVRVFTAVILFAFLFGFACGNSLATRTSLEKQRTTWAEALKTLRDQIHQDRLDDWKKHARMPNGGNGDEKK